MRGEGRGGGEAISKIDEYGKGWKIGDATLSLVRNVSKRHPTIRPYRYYRRDFAIFDVINLLSIYIENIDVHKDDRYFFDVRFEEDALTASRKERTRQHLYF